MGWWGAGILEGDTPADMEGWYQQRFASAETLKKYEDASTTDEMVEAVAVMTDQFRNAVEAMSDDEKKLLIVRALHAYLTGDSADTNNLANVRSSGSRDYPIAVQVFAFMAMELGVTLSDEMKEFLITWIEKDDWAQREDDRREAINQLVEAVRSYNNQPTAVAQQRGLLEMVEEAVVNGKDGLINRNI